MSISACVQAAGASAGTDASASAWTARAVGAAPSSAVIRVSTRRTLVSTAPTGMPNAIAATARAVYGPTPGSVSSVAMSDGHLPP